MPSSCACKREPSSKTPSTLAPVWPIRTAPGLERGGAGARRADPPLRRTRGPGRGLAVARRGPHACRVRPKRRGQDDPAARAGDAAPPPRGQRAGARQRAAGRVLGGARARRPARPRAAALPRADRAREPRAFTRACTASATSACDELLEAVAMGRARRRAAARALARHGPARGRRPRGAARSRAAAAGRAQREPRPRGRRARRAADRRAPGSPTPAWSRRAPASAPHARDLQSRPERRPGRGRRRARPARRAAPRCCAPRATFDPDEIAELYR